MWFTRRTLPAAALSRRGSNGPLAHPHRYSPPLVTGRWTTFVAIAILGLALGASGCSGDDDDGEKKAGASTTTTGDRPARPRPRPPTERDDARREAADAKQQERELKDLKEDDREFEESFKETPFERAVHKLPVRKPPLYVEQYIVTGEGHKVFTGVNEKRFCRQSAAKRQAAVSSFYRAADRSLRAAGVKDFVQVVTPLAATADNLPALATGRAGKVSLSRRGRSC